MIKDVSFLCLITRMAFAGRVAKMLALSSILREEED
jgi:hypothetical protein